LTVLFGLDDYGNLASSAHSESTDSLGGCVGSFPTLVVLESFSTVGVAISTVAPFLLLNLGLYHKKLNTVHESP